MAASLAACGGGGESPAAPSDSVGLAECIKSTAQQVADINQEPVDKYLEDADVRATCEGLAKLDDPAIMPSYTPAPAEAVDQECLREWAENALKPDSAIGGFENMTVEEVMEDPMARFACE